MDTHRSRFSVLPAIVALFIGWASMSPTNVVVVNRDGMGLEHEQPWRATSNGLTGLSTSAKRMVASLSQRLADAQQHALFKPLVAGLALLVGALIDPSVLLAAPLAIGAILTEGQHTAEAIVWEANAMFRKAITVLSGQNLKAGAVVGRVTKGIGRAASAFAGTGNGTMTGLFVGPEVEKGDYVVTCTAAAANGGTFSVTTPSGKLLPNATVAVAYTSRHINFTINDGATDFIVDDTFTITVGTTAPVVSGTGNGTIGTITLGQDAKPGRYLLRCIAAAANAGTFSVVSPDGDRLADATVAVAYTSRQVNFTIADGATDYIVGDTYELVVFNELAGGKVVAWDPTAVDGRQRFAGVLYAAIDASAADVKGVVVDSNAAVSKGALQWGAAITAAQKESAYLEMAAKNIVALDAAA